MIAQTKRSSLILTVIFGILLCNSHTILSANGVVLYTPYTKISVPPGQSIDYTVDIINNGSELQQIDISVAGIPATWSYSLKSGGWNIKQIAILPGEKKSISLKVEVPFRVNKGTYHFRVLAGGLASLSLAVNVSEQGTFETEFTTDQANMEGKTNSTFTYKANLRNRTADKQNYALMADAPRGWDITFKANYKPVTSVEVEANSTMAVTVEIKAPELTEAGSYKIPVRAVTSGTSAELVLEAVIKGTYNLELTTPTGLLSTNITAGSDKKVELVLKNTGSSDLLGVKMSSSTPANWSVTFDPKSIDKLEPGKNAQVFATIKADKKAIPGDYVTTLEARTPEASSKASFRVAVKTPVLWGWIGLLIILIAVGSVYYLFRKYGRR